MQSGLPATTLCGEEYLHCGAVGRSFELRSSSCIPAFTSRDHSCHDPDMPITASDGSVAFAAARPDLDDLIKRRFFYRQAFEIYGGTGGFYTYGPPGAAVKQNLIALWRNHFVIEENLLEVDDTCIMPHEVLLTSGHVERFNDFIVKDAKVPHALTSLS